MKLVKEHLNEKKQETHDVNELAYEFITDVLKMNTADNLFHKFLEKKKLNSNNLNILIKAVIKRIENKWL